MSPEEKKLLIQTYELSKETNRMLHSMRRSAMIGRLFSYLYWILIIVASWYAYKMTVEPLINSSKQMLGQITNIGGSGSGQGASSEFGEVLKLLNEK